MAQDNKASKALQDTLEELVVEYTAKEGISRNELCKLIGIKPSSLSAYLNSEKEAGISSLLKIAEFFDVDTDFLLGKSPTRKAENKEIFKATGLYDSSIRVLKSCIDDSQLLTIKMIPYSKIKIAKIMIMNNLLDEVLFPKMLDDMTDMVFLKKAGLLDFDECKEEAKKNTKRFRDGFRVLTPLENFQFKGTYVQSAFWNIANNAVDRTITALERREQKIKGDSENG